MVSKGEYYIKKKLGYGISWNVKHKEKANMDEQLSNKETVRGKSAVEFPSTDNPVADIDMQDLIDKQIETGEPIILIMPKNVPEEDLPSSSKDLLSSNEDAIDGISRAWIESLIPNHSEE